MSLNLNIEQSIQGLFTAALTFGSVQSAVAMAKTSHLVDGAGAGLINRLYMAERTLAASATEDLDLSGSLLQPDGSAFVLARLKVLYVEALAANTNNVNITRPASNGVPLYLAAADGEPVHPGGVICKVWPGATAIPVTASTGDLITFTNSAGTTGVTYRILMAGCAT